MRILIETEKKYAISSLDGKGILRCDPECDFCYEDYASFSEFQCSKHWMKEWNKPDHPCPVAEEAKSVLITEETWANVFFCGDCINFDLSISCPDVGKCLIHGAKEVFSIVCKKFEKRD